MNVVVAAGFITPQTPFKEKFKNKEWRLS